jgi:hypothetical protein
MRAVEPSTDWLLATETERETNAVKSKIDEWHKEAILLQFPRIRSFVPDRTCGEKW